MSSTPAPKKRFARMSDDEFKAAKEAKADAAKAARAKTNDTVVGVRQQVSIHVGTPIISFIKN
jgi:hypothetical protein